MKSSARSHKSDPSASRIAAAFVDDEEKNGEHFLVVTSQFAKASAALRRNLRNWRKSREGTLVLMTGPSGAGKTTVADVILEQIEDEWHGTLSVGRTRNDADASHEDDVDEDDIDRGDIDDKGPVGRLPRTAGVFLEGPNGIVRPIVKVVVDPKVRARGLLRDIVRALGIMPKAGATFGELMEMLQIQLEQQHVRMIMLDEVHHIVERQGSLIAYEASEVVKMLLVQARLQVVCIGLPHAESIVDNNPELPRHLRKRVPLKAMVFDLRKGSEYIKFLAALSSHLTVKADPRLDESALALNLHVASEGLIGQLTNLVDAAVDIALDDGSSAVKIHHFAEAFDDIEGTSPAKKAENEENPFRIADVTEASFAPIRARIEARRKSLKGRPAQHGKLQPDFSLR